jgi:hypothetical protein
MGRWKRDGNVALMAHAFHIPLLPEWATPPPPPLHLIIYFPSSSSYFRLVSPPQLVNMLTPNKKLNSDLTSRFSYSFSSYRQFRLRNNLISWGWFPFLVGSHDPSREKDKRY